MKDQKKYKKISWNTIDKAVDTLAEQIKASSLAIDNIYGIPKGGLIIATMLAYRLDIPLLTTESHIGTKTIIIDDIIDTGRTIFELLQKHKPFITISVFWKPNCPMEPDYYVFEKKDDSWIIFPWALNDLGPNK